MIREALQYVAGLAIENEKTEVIEICGKTYANRDLRRYDKSEKADAIETHSLTSMVDYIGSCSQEFPEGRDMIIHIMGPKRVRLMSSLDAERNRECLIEVGAVTSEFQFGHWYDQEKFMIEIQANFEPSPDLELIMKVAGNMERKNEQSYSDDGVSQVATMTVGVAAKADVIVPNPVELIPYRTFQEVAQPASKFVFRIGDKDEPAFMIVEAENGIWKNEAVSNIKKYFADAFMEMPEAISKRITIIG